MLLLEKANDLAPGESVAVSRDEVLQSIPVCCSFYASAVKKPRKLLYRGVSGCMDEYFIARPRTDRRPLTTPLQVHDSFVAWLDRNGFVANRQNSLFTTSDIRSTEKYGNVYAIFPFDGFDFTWSPACRDLFCHWNERTGTDQTVPVAPMLEQLHYTKEDLKGAIVSGNEVMVASRPYLAVRRDLIDDLVASLKLFE
jgi:hypothetical protein